AFIGEVLPSNSGVGEPFPGQSVGFSFDPLDDLSHSTQCRHCDISVQEVVIIRVLSGEMVHIGAAQCCAEYAGGGSVVVFNGPRVGTDGKWQHLQATANPCVELLTTHRDYIVSGLVDVFLVLEGAAI